MSQKVCKKGNGRKPVVDSGVKRAKGEFVRGKSLDSDPWNLDIKN